MFVAVADALLTVAVRLDARAWERDGEAVTLIHARVVSGGGDTRGVERDLEM